MSYKENRKSFLTEFRESTRMEKFNFIASLGTVSGVSIFTIVSGIDKLNTYQIGFYSIAFGVVFAIVSFIIGIYYWALTLLKNDSSPIYFLLVFIILTSIGIGFLLIIVTSAWEFITTINF